MWVCVTKDWSEKVNRSTQVTARHPEFLPATLVAGFLIQPVFDDIERQAYSRDRKKPLWPPSRDYKCVTRFKLSPVMASGILAVTAYNQFHSSAV